MESTTREHPEAREAREALLVVERARTTAARHSLNNGALLLVWGDTFLLDMVAFDASRLVGTVWPAVAFVVVFNSAVVLWKVWYERRMPVRPLTIQFDRVIFWWAWYHAALVGLGVGAWAIFIGRFPPLWLTAIGLAGALPLYIAGIRQRQLACADVPAPGGMRWQ
jgi:hypothetical protein